MTSTQVPSTYVLAFSKPSPLGTPVSGHVKNLCCADGVQQPSSYSLCLPKPRLVGIETNPGPGVRDILPPDSMSCSSDKLSEFSEFNDPEPLPKSASGAWIEVPKRPANPPPYPSLNDNELATLEWATAVSSVSHMDLFHAHLFQPQPYYAVPSVDEPQFYKEFFEQLEREKKQKTIQEKLKNIFLIKQFTKMTKKITSLKFLKRRFSGPKSFGTGPLKNQAKKIKLTKNGKFIKDDLLWKKITKNFEKQLKNDRDYKSDTLRPQMFNMSLLNVDTSKLDRLTSILESGIKIDHNLSTNIFGMVDNVNLSMDKAATKDRKSVV